MPLGGARQHDGIEQIVDAASLRSRFHHRLRYGKAGATQQTQPPGAAFRLAFGAEHRLATVEQSEGQFGMRFDAALLALRRDPGIEIVQLRE